MASRIQHAEAPTDTLAAVTVSWPSPTTANSILIAWANSSATIATPTGFTAIDSQVNGNGAYAWYKVAAGSDANVTFTPGSTGFPVTAGIIEVGGALTTGVPAAHVAIYSGGEDVVSPPATITVPATSYLLGLAFSHDYTASVPGAIVSWTTPLTNFVSPTSSNSPPPGGCFAFVADATPVAAGSLTLNATWTSSSGRDRNTFLIAIQDIGAAGTPTAATATGAARTIASATVAPVITTAAATGAARDASVVTFTGSGAPGGQAAGTGASKTPTVTVSPVPAPGTGAGLVGDVSTIFTGPSAGAGVAWPVRTTVQPNAELAAGTGAALQPADSDATNIGVATSTGTAWQPTLTFGTADVTVNPGVATAAGFVPQPGFTVSLSGGLGTATGLAGASNALLAPNAQRAPATGLALFLGSIISTSVAHATGVAYDAATNHAHNLYRFECPSWDQIPPIADEASPLANRLTRFLKPRPMGRNIWTLPDGSLTFDQPWPLADDSGATRQGFFPNTAPALGSSWSNLQTVTYTHVYWGGHVYYLDLTDSAQLGEALKLDLFLRTQGYNPSDWLVPA